MTDNPSPIATSAMVLPDGVILEQLTGYRLLFFGGGETSISPVVAHAGQTYVPLALDPALDPVLSQDVLAYHDFGGLFDDLCDEIIASTGLERRFSLLLASFILTTWVTDFLPSPVLLNIWGASGAETAVWPVLAALVRRPLALSEPSPSQCDQLPRTLDPTLFLRYPSAAALNRLLDLSTGVPVFHRGHILRFASPIVVLTSTPIARPALQIPLAAQSFPIRHKAGDEKLRTLRSQLLHYRLDHAARVTHSMFDTSRFTLALRPLAGSLASCLAGHNSCGALVATMLEPLEEGLRTQAAEEPQAAVLEGLLVLMHENRSKALVREIAELANGILLAREEVSRLTAKQVGHILRNDLGLTTRRVGAGRELRLDSGTCRTVHRQAAARAVPSLLLPRQDCSFCSSLTRAAKAPSEKPDAEGSETADAQATASPTPDANQPIHSAESAPQSGAQPSGEQAAASASTPRAQCAQSASSPEVSVRLESSPAAAATNLEASHAQ